jgi:membrane-associated protein
MFETISPALSNTSIYSILFLSLLSNGIFNIPSSQFVYITFGYILTVKEISAVTGILLGTIANTISNYILYLICLKGSNNVSGRLSKFIDVNKEKIDKYIILLQKRGILWMIIGKSIPSLKVFIPIIAGLANISKLRALIIFFFGSLIWACGITYIGYHFGKKLDLAEFYGYYFLFVFALGVILSALYNIKKFKK